METTKLSTKGQIVLPKELRSARAWVPGTEFTVEATPEGVLLRPVTQAKKYSISDLAGILKRPGRAPLTDKQIKAALDREVKRKYDSGRY